MTTEEIIIIKCDKYKIKDYTINDDGSIDVNRSVDLSAKNLTTLPLKFRNVFGYFDCSVNNLEKLDNSPRYVSGDFYCHQNNLITLKGGPVKVDGSFRCDSNKLTSLDYSPIEFKNENLGYINYFSFRYNPLETLRGVPLDLEREVFGFDTNFSYDDYLEYCKHVKRDLKFKKILK